MGTVLVRDVVADRMQVVGNMEAMRYNSERKIKLTTLHTAGLGIEVPGPARFLVDTDRSRAIFEGLRATKRSELFAQCDNCNCLRLLWSDPLVTTCAKFEVSDRSVFATAP